MQATALKGKIIKRVHQRRYDDYNAFGPAPWVVEAIEFADGSYLRFSVVEPARGCEYGVKLIYPARELKVRS